MLMQIYCAHSLLLHIWLHAAKTTSCCGSYLGYAFFGIWEHCIFWQSCQSSVCSVIDLIDAAVSYLHKVIHSCIDSTIQSPCIHAACRSHPHAQRLSQTSASSSPLEHSVPTQMNAPGSKASQQIRCCTKRQTASS